MGERVRPLIEAAKHLSVEEREELLEGLLQMDGEFEPDLAGIAEWKRRFEEIDAGAIEGVDAGDAIAAARAELKSRRPA
jgi:hypothetical protein